MSDRESKTAATFREGELDSLFDAARMDAPLPTDALLARIAADAQRFGAERWSVPPSRPARIGLWRQILDALGGVPAVTGLAAASVAGLWIGIDPPEAALGWIDQQGVSVEEIGVDPLSGYDLALWGEAE